MTNKVLRGAIKTPNGITYEVDVIDILPSPDVTLTTVTGFTSVELADDYLMGLQSLNNKSAKYLEGVQKALDILTA